MANYNDIKADKEKAEGRLVNAEADLKKFEGGENNGKWLEDLREKARSGELNEEGKQEKKRLEEEKKRLKEEKKNWGEQVQYLQKELTKFNKGKGNEQKLCKKYTKNYFSFVPFHLFVWYTAYDFLLYPIRPLLPYR